MKLCVSSTLNAFNFVPIATSLSMFPLIQWLSDLALFVVVAFTSHHNKDSAPGVSIRTTRDRIRLCCCSILPLAQFDIFLFLRVHYNL